MDRLKQIESFAAVAAKGSLTAAALAEGGVGAVDQVNEMTAKINRISERMGGNAANHFYKAGVYAHPDSVRAGEDRAVTLVGWGEEKLANGRMAPYWIILNSWGPTWCGVAMPQH